VIYEPSPLDFARKRLAGVARDLVSFLKTSGGEEADNKCIDVRLEVCFRQYAINEY
jgi:hypothetical protein